MRGTKIAGLALSGLRRTPLRATLTTLGVTIASGAIVTMVALALGIQRQVEVPFQALGLFNNIQVKPKDDDFTRGGFHVPGDRGVKLAEEKNSAESKSQTADADSPPLDDDAIRRMEQVEGVTVVYPDVRLRGIKVRFGDKEETAIGIAMPREMALLGADDVIVAGRFLSAGTEPEVILGAQIVRGLKFSSPQEALGTQVTVEAVGLSPEGGKSFAFERKKLSVTVVGVYEAPMVLPGLAQRGIILPVELMKQIPGIHFESAFSRLKAGKAAASGYASVTVRVHDPSYLSSVEDEIKAMGFQTRTVMSQLQGMRTLFVAIQLLLALVGTIAMVVAALGIVNTLLMSVLERYQEIGICKAIGASDGDLLVLFLTEAGFIGLLGGLTGLVIGWLSSLGLESAAGAYARSQGIVGKLELFAFPPWLLAATVGFAVAMSIIAGIYPALRAARVDPIRALRSQ
jgi:putative ABC transport system permease protein